MSKFAIKGLLDLVKTYVKVNVLGTEYDIPLQQLKESIIDSPAVYTAILTQELSSATSGLLTVGETYVIASVAVGDDFLNVGYTEDDAPFVATFATPTEWSNGTVVVNLTQSAPTAEVIYNDLGEIEYEYLMVGISNILSDGLFTENKTFCLATPMYNDGSFGIPVVGVDDDSTTSQLTVRIYDSGFTLYDNWKIQLEIKVYN